jgi:hypothetical protein
MLAMVPPRCYNSLRAAADRIITVIDTVILYGGNEMAMGAVLRRIRTRGGPADIQHMIILLF